MVQVGDKYTEVDRSNMWKVTKVHPSGKVDMNNGVCTIKDVDLETKNYHMAHFGKNQFQPFRPKYRYYMEAQGFRDEQMETIEEAEEWAGLMMEEGATFEIVDQTNDNVVFSSTLQPTVEQVLALGSIDFNPK